jgi:hypothetical protein
MIVFLTNALFCMYDKIAMERYKGMAAYKKKPLVCQHCWALLEHSEKWRLRDN